MDPVYPNNFRTLFPSFEVGESKRPVPFTDISLHFPGDVVVQAHKFVLSAHSNIMRSVLRADPTRTMLHLKAGDATHFALILQYLYCGLPNQSHASLQRVELQARMFKFNSLAEHLQKLRLGSATGSDYLTECSYKMRRCVNKKVDADISLILTDHQGVTHILYAHKAILVARSPVFRAQLLGPLASSTVCPRISSDI